MKTTNGKHGMVPQDPLIKEVSILIADIRGFAQLSERYTTTRVVELLNKYFQVMNLIIVKHGGTIDKYVGDSVMAVFDATSDMKGSILNALTCALEMQISMDEVNKYANSLGMEDIYMGIGINTGRVVSCTMGSDLYHENTVIGDEVNIASRVEAFSLRGQILISENTYDHIKDCAEIGISNEVAVKGVKNNIKIFELLAITSPVRLEAPERDGRKSPRIEMELPLNYQFINNKIILPDVYKANTLDLSYNGMSIITNHAINAYSDLKLSVPFPAMNMTFNDIYAKALRATSTGTDCCVGLEFTAMDDNARRAIKFIVDSHI